MHDSEPYDPGIRWVDSLYSDNSYDAFCFRVCRPFHVKKCAVGKRL